MANWTIMVGFCLACTISVCSAAIQLYYVKTSLPTNECRFNLYYRNVFVDVNNCGVSKKSTGHFFISLEGDGLETFVGKYGSNLIYGLEDIRSKEEADTFACLRKLEKKKNRKYIDMKSIKIDKKEFVRAIQFIQNRKPEYYTLVSGNCIDYVQEVYNSMDLPLYFTSSMYRKDQLNNLEGLAAKWARQQYPSIDEIASTLNKIHASSIDKLSAELNIDDEYIFQYHGENTAFHVSIFLTLPDILDLQVENSEINSEVINRQMNENFMNLRENNDNNRFCSLKDRPLPLKTDHVPTYDWRTSRALFKTRACQFVKVPTKRPLDLQTPNEIECLCCPP